MRRNSSRVFASAMLALGLALRPLPAAAEEPVPTAVDPVEIFADGFRELTGIVVDGDGNVFVADGATGAVTRIAIDRTRTTIAKGLKWPVGLALDLNGRLLIAEERAGRVVRVEPNGSHTTILSGIREPRWLTVRDDGTLYVSARHPTRDTDIDAERTDGATGQEAILALSPAGVPSVFATGFLDLQGLAVNHTTLFAAAVGRHGLRHVTGVIFQIAIQSDGTAGTMTPVGPTNAFRQPVGLVRDRLGEPYLTTPELRVKQAHEDEREEGDEDPAHRAVAKLHLGDGHVSAYAQHLGSPQGLTFNAQGDLYVTDGGRVLRFLAPRAPTLSPPAFTSQSLLTVTGMTEPSAEVDLFLNDATTPVTVTADATGAFTA